MAKARFKERGVALFIVLATIMIVIVLANVILNIILSQSRLTQHQVSRIQAYYAAQAGMNLAFERLRTGNTSSFSLCSSGCTVNDSNIPFRVDINVGTPNPSTGIRTLSITTTYTYTP